MTIVGVFYNREFRTGGHTRYIELMEALARRGHRVHVLMNSLLPYQPRHFEAVRTRVAYRRKGFPPASWVFAAAAKREVEALRPRIIGTPDAVIVFGETHLAAGKALAQGLAAHLVYAHRSNGVREGLTYSSEMRGAPIQRLRLLPHIAKSMWDERRIARAADLIVFQSSYDRDDFRARVAVPDAQVAIIRGDITGPRFKPEYANANRSMVLKQVAFMGTQGRRKGLDYLIEAVGILYARGNIGLHFEICGPGERFQELSARVARSGLSEVVTLRGKVPDPFTVIGSSDLLVVPSLFDSYPNSVLEALHVGTPVIGSRVGGIPDQLQFDELLFPPMDAKAIADRIERCVREPAFYQRIRKLCAERRVTFEFDWAEAWENEIAALSRGQQ